MKFAKFFVSILLFGQFVCGSQLDIVRSLIDRTWPSKKPEVAVDHHGWFYNQTQLAKILNRDVKLIIEIGSWLGSSSRFILDHAPNALLVAIDHWEGSSEHKADPNFSTRLSNLYETFLVNCWDYRSRLLPLKMPSSRGLPEIHKLGLVPDLIYVDGAHEYEYVLEDLRLAFTLFPKAILCGDDWRTPSVAAAVRDFALDRDLAFSYDNNFWIFD